MKCAGSDDLRWWTSSSRRRPGRPSKETEIIDAFQYLRDNSLIDYGGPQIAVIEAVRKRVLEIASTKSDSGLGPEAIRQASHSSIVPAVRKNAPETTNYKLETQFKGPFIRAETAFISTWPDTLIGATKCKIPTAVIGHSKSSAFRKLTQIERSAPELRAGPGKHRIDTCCPITRASRKLPGPLMFPRAPSIAGYGLKITSSAGLRLEIRDRLFITFTTIKKHLW